jgi:hypothetical protein
MTPKNRKEDLKFSASIYSHLQKNNNAADFVTRIINFYLCRIPTDFNLGFYIKEYYVRGLGNAIGIEIIPFQKGRSAASFNVLCTFMIGPDTITYNDDNPFYVETKI